MPAARVDTLPKRTAVSLARSPELFVAIVALLLAFAVDPRGNFPLNDDWAYAHSVQWLLGEHRIRLSDWIAMNLLPQTLAGGVFTAVAGFSFDALRLLTQVVSVAVAAMTARWFLAVGLAPRDAVLATLTVLAVPCWLPLADSYMTDLYGMFFAIPAATLFIRALRVPSPSSIAGGTLLAVAGVLQRQVVLVVPVAFMVAWLATLGRRRPAHFWWGVLPALAAFGAALLYWLYLTRGPGVPAAQKWLQGRVVAAIVKTMENEGGWYRGWVVANALSIVAYLGLFAAPFVLWRGWPANVRVRWGIGILAALVLATIAITGFWPPWRAEQVIDAAGIGPFVLYDAQPRGLAPLDRGTGWLWHFAGALAAFGIASLCRTGLAATRAIAADIAAGEGQRVFLAALIAAYLAPFILTDYFDRYLLFVLPFVLALAALAEPGDAGRIARMAGLLALCAELVLGVMATHDYFAWNRARWDAIHAAETLGATPANLDGGFEYNGFYRFGLPPRTPRADRSWWWVDDDRFVVTFGPVRGYSERGRFPVERWLPRTPPVVLLLERIRP